MKPGDLAIVKCRRAPYLDGKIALLVEWSKPPDLHRSTWLCVVNGEQEYIPSGWLKEIK
jgi:hypothetical protein